MSVYDIFKSISTVKVPVKNIEKSTSSGRENLNFHSTSNNSGISNRNNLLTTETQGITSPSCITSFSDEKDSFDVSFINMQNSLEKTRQWRFLRSHLYIPSLVQFAKANKFDLQRFEKK